MEGLLHLFDFNQPSTSRKSVSSKKQDGMDAPRNSLELPAETFENNVAVGAYIPYSYQEMHNYYYSSGAPMKKLIDEEISKEPEARRNAPSVVARLMGMDTLPSDARPIIRGKTKGDVITQMSKEQVRNGSVRRSPLALKHSKQMEDDLPYQIREKPREHPQEEQLQKFKKDFVAWQAARVWEHARVVENDKIPRQWYAQQVVNKENKAKTKPVEKRQVHVMERSSHKFEHQGYIDEPVRKESATSDDNQHQVFSSIHEHSAPTRIVILKPGPDTSGSRGESWASSSEIIEDDEGSMEDFLEEVKERLRFEMRGKRAKRDFVVRASNRTEQTPLSEKPSSPRKIANEIRESVGMNLTRSRSYRNEVEVNGSGSPEFMDRDTRILLQQRLRNVMKDESLGQPEAFKGDGQQNDISPRNLVRCMSAPVSGTAFGKLLLEDRHVLTGAHIRRRQEASENVSARKTKKEKLGFKGKVSNLRYKFTFSFGRKVESVEESWSNSNSMKGGPTVMTNLASLQENSTEVPPSPASVCSSSHEEFYRVMEHPSPISALDVPMIEDHIACRNISSSNLRELRRQLNQLESDTAKVEETIVLGPAEAYIKDLLIVSGFYDGSCAPISKPLSSWVFEKVEENYRKGTEDKIQIDRNILFDLSNEALLGHMSSFKRNGTTVPPHGKELLDSIWKMIHMYVCPPYDASFYSLDSLVSRDLNTAPWSGIMHTDVDTIGNDIENLILGKLIEETVSELWL